MDPDIDTSHLPKFSAAEVFRTKVLEPDANTDFRTERSDVSYRPQYHSYEIDETLEDKIARLTKEVAEVQQEVENNTKNTQLLGTDRQLKNIEDLNTILEKLRSINLKDNSDDTTDVPKEVNISNITDKSTTSHHKKPTNSKILEENSKQISKIADIDNRIAVLETMIGLDELDTTNPAYRPILFSLQETRQRLKLITTSPTALEKSANNLKSVIEVVGKIQALNTTRDCKKSNIGLRSDRKNAEDLTLSANNKNMSFEIKPKEFNSDGTLKSNSQKINELYFKLDTVEKLEEIMPKVLSRLKSLRDLHTDALVTHSSVQEFDEIVLSLTTDIKEWKETQNVVQEKIEKLEHTSAENKKKVKEWNNDLYKKLKKNTVKNV